MELVYKDGVIVEVNIENPVLQQKLTKQEKLTFFACEAPNLTVWQNVTWLETGAKNEDDTPKSTLEGTVASMVSAGLITSQRANEILA